MVKEVALYYLLRIKTRKTNDDISLCQSHHIEKVLKTLNYCDVPSVRTPHNPSIHLKKNKGSTIFQTEYAKIIENVMFLRNYG